MPLPKTGISHALSAPGGTLPAQLARLEALLEAVPLAIALFDERMLLVRANSRFHELTNHAPGGAYGHSLRDALPAELADLATAALRGPPGDPPHTRRVRFPVPGGERLVDATIAVLGQELGGGVLVTAADLAEGEALRASLARQDAELESSFDVIPDSVRVFDTAGVVLRANRQALLDHGGRAPATLEEVWALDAPRALDGAPLRREDHPTVRALAGETVRGYEIAVQRGTSSEQVIVEVSSNPLRDAQGHVIGAVTVERDVTERARLALELAEEVRRSLTLYERVSTEAERLERMVEERTRELLALQERRSRDRRLAAVGQLAAGVMHDVNNALNPIVAAAYLLEVHADRPAAVRDYAARIARAAETGAATAARVGRFIRQDPLPDVRDGDAVDLGTIAQEIVDMTRPLWAERAQGHVQLELECAAGVVARGIPGEMREAMLNLVQNALDAMSGGGTLGIAARCADGEAVLEVRDTGAGMSEEVRERAFEPFFSTKGHRGTGLGLSEVYGIVRRHHGRVELESAPGSGTTVRLRFPLADSPARTAPAMAQRAGRVPRRILLVEDNREGRDFMQAVLESDGHRVEAVAWFEEALLRLQVPDGTAPYDVLVTDVGLPDGSGWDLARAARERWPAMRIGVVTGWETAAADGAADFTLRKPVSAQEFLSQVAVSSA